MDYVELLRSRQSVRRFTPEQISQDHLAAIVAAASGAPVGSNRYEDIHLTVVQRRNVLDKLADAAIKRWEDKDVIRRIVGDNPGAGIERKMTDPFYGAPTVIFVSHRKQDIQPGIEFANVACVAGFMHLDAANLGLGSVLMWIALESMRAIPALDNTAILRLPDGFEPLLGVAVGHPAGNVSAREARADKISVNYMQERNCCPQEAGEAGASARC
jgi:nitroreductase